uniref:C2 domain-containing protein n=1 Tax=Paramoeba aestuarina TaxID=180227 RepID=A0A7S4PC42_9EUKA
MSSGESPNPYNIPFGVPPYSQHGEKTGLLWCHQTVPDSYPDSAPVPYWEDDAKLTVYIEKGTDLIIKDSKSSDPYVKFTITGQQEQKTRVIKKTLNPQWNEAFTFQMSDYWEKSIKLEVWDKDKISSDDFMGVVPEHPIHPCGLYSPYKKGGATETAIPGTKVWWKCVYPLQEDGRGKTKGTITVWYHLSHIFDKDTRRDYFKESIGSNSKRKAVEARLKEVPKMTPMEIQKFICHMREQPIGLITLQLDTQTPSALDVLIREMANTNDNAEDKVKWDVCLQILKFLFESKMWNEISENERHLFMNPDFFGIMNDVKNNCLDKQQLKQRCGYYMHQKWVNKSYKKQPKQAKEEGLGTVFARWQKEVEKQGPSSSQPHKHGPEMQTQFDKPPSAASNSATFWTQNLAQMHHEEKMDYWEK